MKVHLLHAERAIPWRAILATAQAREAARTGRRSGTVPQEPSSPRPWNAPELIRDLQLDNVFTAMASGDGLVREVVETVVLNATQNDVETIRYRQSVLSDSLAQPDLVRELYDLATDAEHRAREHYIGALLTRYPDWSLRNSIAVLTALLEPIKRLHAIAETRSTAFQSAGWQHLFSEIRKNLDSERLENIKRHLEGLRFRDGVLLSARLGPGNHGQDFRLHPVPRKPGGWLRRFLRSCFPRSFTRTSAFDFALDPRDESGARSLREVRNRGLAIAAGSLEKASDHVRDFFSMLRCELAFYVGCLNLHEQLHDRGVALCIPMPHAGTPHQLRTRDLRDVVLVLDGVQRVVGNDLDTEAKDLLVVTGANRGGKSTFLRSLGLAQLMMQAGLFVAAQSFGASICDGIFTHYAREEDLSLRSGKLDEELARLSAIVDHLTADPLILCNESLAATNEREGSEIARQVATALLERKKRLVFVTHLYEFARTMYELAPEGVLFLRAERSDDGARPFRMVEGVPIETGFAADLYAGIFGSPAVEPPPEANSARLDGRDPQGVSAR